MGCISSTKARGKRGARPDRLYRLIAFRRWRAGYNFTIHFGGCTSPNISSAAYVNSMPVAASIADLQIYDYVASPRADSRLLRKCSVLKPASADAEVSNRRVLRGQHALLSWLTGPCAVQQNGCRCGLATAGRSTVP